MRERLVSGDETALAEVYDEYAPSVFGVAKRITRDAGLAEDVTQEVFVGLWERPESYDPDRGPLSAWLWLLARRRAIDVVRRVTAQDRRESAWASAIVAVMPGIEDGIIHDTVAKTVRAAVAKLPEPQREAIVLAYYHGLTYTQVAQHVGVPEGTAKSRLRSALRSLAGHLEAADLL